MQFGLMSKICALGLLAATLHPLHATAGESEPGKPIRPESDCLVANHVSAWGVIHDQRLVVKSVGERYYDIQLAQSCPKLEREHFLSFRKGFMPTSGSRTPNLLICGDMGDAVKLNRGIGGSSNPCLISSIRRIDRATFDAVFGKDSNSGDSALDQAPDYRGKVAVGN